MPVTTRRQSRGLLEESNAFEESERDQSEDGVLDDSQESDGDDDTVTMAGSSVESSSSDEDEEHGSVWGGPGSDVSDEESNDEVGNASESDDYFEATTPTPKRRKLEQAGPLENASTSKPPSKTKRGGLSRRVQGRLQNMLSLPLDVLFVIFSELGPMDLLNLARTSKALRQVLMSRKSISIWIAARRAAGATMAPEPPEDMSEPSWAQLLFGPAVCSQCSTKNIHRVDFALRRRLCIVCRKRNLVFSIKFRSQCPGLKESVMDLLPYTKIGGWAHGHASNSRFYWKPDLYEIGKRLAELEEDVDAGKPGAQKRLKSFRAERILLVDSIIQGCSEFEKWVKAEAEAQAHNAYERRNQRREALKIHILALGFELADIDFIGMHDVPGSNVDKPLTDDAWRRIRAKVETKLSAAREARLLAARRRRESEYKYKAKGCYSDLLCQVLPVQRLCLPALSQVSELSCFKDLLNADRDVQPAEWEHAEDQLPQSLSEWMSEHRDKYTSLLPSHAQGVRGKAMTIRLLSDPSIDNWRHEAMASFAGPLDLATSVFRETNSGLILIGRDVCYAWGVKGPQLEFSARGAEAVHTLLRVLQLDPTSTTVSTLEQLSIQFICASCPQDVAERYLSWRTCVLHFVESSETDHPYPQWQMVGPDYAASTSSVWHPRPRIERWLCNHCGDYVMSDVIHLGSRADIVQHLHVMHNVDDPVVDVDLFPYPMFEYFPEITEL